VEFSIVPRKTRNDGGGDDVIPLYIVKCRSPARTLSWFPLISKRSS